MSSLTRILGTGHHNDSPHHRCEGVLNQPGIGESSMRLLVVSGDSALYSNLEELASTCGWKIRLAATVEEAIPIVVSESTPLIIYDWNLTDDNWSSAFDRLNGLGIAMCILLASRVADPYLWQEVIRFGGFDLLPRSAPRDEWIRKLRFAWFWNRSLRPSRAATPNTTPKRG